VTQLLQKPSQRVQRRPKAPQSPRLQACHRLIIRVESLLSPSRGRACQRRARLGGWGRGGRGSFPAQRPQRLGQCLLHDHTVSIRCNDALELGELASLRPQKWVHGKRAIAEPDRKLGVDERKHRICTYYACELLEPIAQ
jgi:hypothetical protein